MAEKRKSGHPETRFVGEPANTGLHRPGARDRQAGISPSAVAGQPCISSAAG